MSLIFTDAMAGNEHHAFAINVRCCTQKSACVTNVVRSPTNNNHLWVKGGKHGSERGVFKQEEHDVDVFALERCTQTVWRPLHWPRHCIGPQAKLTSPSHARPWLSPWLRSTGGREDVRGGGPADEDAMIMMMMMKMRMLLVLIVRASPPGGGSFCFRLTPTTLCPWPLPPTPGKHSPGEKSTQQEFRRTRSTVRVCLPTPPEQGCVCAVMSVLFAHFMDTRQDIFFQLDQEKQTFTI